MHKHSRNFFTPHCGAESISRPADTKSVSCRWHTRKKCSTKPVLLSWKRPPKRTPDERRQGGLNMKVRRQNSNVKQLVVLGGLLLSLVLFAGPNVRAQGGSDSDRTRALQLLRDGKFADAQQILEKLAAANPSDADVQFSLG